MSSITLQLLPKGKPIKRLPSDIKIEKDASAAEIYQQIAMKSHFSIYRLRITKGSDGTVVPNERNVPLVQTGLLDGSNIYIKDLGPQIGWRLCYVIEYLGPILIHPVFYFARPYIYSKPAQEVEFPAPSSLQTIALGMILTHFIKRELETLFVHRFSNATMPFTNIYKNCAHYWLLSGVLLAFFTYSPYFGPQTDNYPILTPVGIALFAIGELLNGYCHIVLMNLRAPGTTERKIPIGFSFNWVTCPNYMWETVAWVGVALITRNIAVAIFTVLGVGQMFIWAKKKEKNYRKQFGDKYKKKRFVMLPGLM